MLTELQYTDVAIVNDIASGFKLTGMVTTNRRILILMFGAQSLTLEQLQKMAPGLNASIIRSVNESPTDAIAEQVWAETMAEVDKGWLEVAQDSTHCSVAKRFGLQQKSKVRMIDDFSISKVNQTYGLRETPAGASR